MKTLSKTGFSILSDELFSSFFTSDKALTEKIINTILDGDFRVDGVEEFELDRARFGYYHPFVLIDAHTKSGRCAITLTHIERGCEDDTSLLVDWMYYQTTLKRRNVYPILVTFDSTDDYLTQKAPVTVRLIEASPVSFALAVVWVRMNTGREELLSLLEDLTAVEEGNIADEDIRRAYGESYIRSGLGEMENVSYSMWLKSIENDIEKLGLDSV